MGAPIAPGVCRICGLDKGGEDKQACNFCWSTLSLAQKRAWYQASWADSSRATPIVSSGVLRDDAEVEA